MKFAKHELEKATSNLLDAIGGDHEVRTVIAGEAPAWPGNSEGSVNCCLQVVAAEGYLAAG